MKIYFLILMLLLCSCTKSEIVINETSQNITEVTKSIGFLAKGNRFVLEPMNLDAGILEPQYEKLEYTITGINDSIITISWSQKIWKSDTQNGIVNFNINSPNGLLPYYIRNESQSSGIWMNTENFLFDLRLEAPSYINSSYGRFLVTSNESGKLDNGVNITYPILLDKKPYFFNATLYLDDAGNSYYVIDDVIPFVAKYEYNPLPGQDQTNLDTVRTLLSYELTEIYTT